MDKQLYKQFLNEVGLKTLLSQNSKMKKSGHIDNMFYNFDLPALKSRTGLVTCPNAGQCAIGCYARSGAFTFPVVQNKLENNLAATRIKGFTDAMIHAIALELDKLGKKNVYYMTIRVHASGDFYSEEYQRAWYWIARYFQGNPRVRFYAYTKQVSQSNDLDSLRPDNFRLIYSTGGKQDYLIVKERQAHSKVFETEQDLQDAGYINASNDDSIATIRENIKIGLVYHGNKNYTNTNWSKV